MNKLILIALLLLQNIVLQAQTTTDLETDRPDQTETPFTVGKFMFQAENGFSRTKVDNLLVQNSLVSLLRFGLSEKFELRAEILRDGYTVDKTKIISGLQPLELGFKVNLLKEKGIIPKTSLIAHITIPKAASKSFKGTYAAPNFRFTMQHSLSKKQSFSYNIGGEWNSDFGTFQPLYTLATGYDFTSKLYGYVELFGFFPKGLTAEHSLDGGLAYLLKPNLQLDISAGAGITKTAPKSYWAIGLSFRLPR
jgi:Putative MetA-pathway of phenol degradation